MSTPNLGLIHVAASQSNKEVPVNAMCDGLDGAIASSLAIDLTANVTPSHATVAPVFVLILSGAQAAQRTLTLPAFKHQYFVINNCTGGFDAKIKCGAGSFVTIPNAEMALIYCDGVNTYATMGNPTVDLTPPAGPTFVYYDITPGRVDSSSLVSGGSGWSVSDTFTIDGGNADAVGVVDTVSGGAVVTYHLSAQGSGYKTTAAAATTTGGGGTGLTIDIVSSGADGSEVAFDLAGTPNPPESLQLFMNGVEQEPDVAYSLSGATATFNVAPPAGAKLWAHYTL
jgi:hypothetical protein